MLTPRPQNLTVFGDRLFKKRGEVVNRRSYEREHEIAQSCPTLRDTMDCSLLGWDFPGKSTPQDCLGR